MEPGAASRRAALKRGGSPSPELRSEGAGKARSSANGRETGFARFRRYGASRRKARCAPSARLKIVAESREPFGETGGAKDLTAPQCAPNRAARNRV